MTVTKFSIEFHATGEFNDTFTRIITNHNEGLTNATLDLFVTYAKARKAEFTRATPDFKIIERPQDSSIHVYENGKATVSIWEKVIIELNTPLPTAEEIEEEIRLEQKTVS